MRWSDCSGGTGASLVPAERRTHGSAPRENQGFSGETRLIAAVIVVVLRAAVMIAAVGIMMAVARLLG